MRRVAWTEGKHCYDDTDGTRYCIKLIRGLSIRQWEIVVDDEELGYCNDERVPGGVYDTLKEALAELKAHVKKQKLSYEEDNG